jgi:protein-disulfide isomerase
MLTPPFVRGHDHALGSGGPVLVVFGDYEDPASAACDRAVLELRDRWDGFTYAWRHLPLSTTANGAALLAEGAADQDAFWAYHHVLLARQDALSVPDLLTYASSIGLDVGQLIAGVESERDVQRILDNVASAKASGTLETPSLFIEGERWMGELDALEGALRAALAG